MRSLAAFVFAAVLPTTGLAQQCAAEFAVLDKQVKGSAQQAAYAGKEDTHPMVLNMADGSLVDLTGQIITEEPYPSWTSDPAIVATVTGLIKQAAPLAAEGKEEECLALLEQAQTAVGVSPGAGSTPPGASGAANPQ
jgi:hypothetical protein